MVIPGVSYFLSLSCDILLTEAVVYRGLSGAFDLAVDLFPCATVGESSFDVQADSGVFTSLRAFIFSIEAVQGCLIG